MINKPILQLLFEMRCCESMLTGGVRVEQLHSKDSIDMRRSVIVAQLKRAGELMEQFEQIPLADRYWGEELIADETYYGLERAVEMAREHIRSSFEMVS